MVQVRSGSSTGAMDHRRCEAPQRRDLCPPRRNDDQWHFTAHQRRTSPRLDSPGGETDPGRIDRRRLSIFGPVQSARDLIPRDALQDALPLDPRQRVRWSGPVKRRPRSIRSGASGVMRLQIEAWCFYRREPPPGPDPNPLHLCYLCGLLLNSLLLLPRV